MTGKIEEFVSRHLKWIFPLPAVIVLMLIAIFPFGYNMYMSLHEWFASSIVSPKFCGLANYLRLIIKDSRFHNALFNTFYIYVMALSIELVLGLLIALVLNKEFRGKGTYRTLILLPIVTTPVAVALVWMIMFNPSFGDPGYNLVDAAIIEVKENDVLAKIVDIGVPKGVKQAQLDMLVQKSGRTTCHTVDGPISGIDATIGPISYGSWRFAYFKDQIVISKEGFSAGGDSGSLVLDMEGYAVGKLFAGSETEKITIANHIQSYLDLLDAELITE